MVKSVLLNKFGRQLLVEIFGKNLDNGQNLELPTNTSEYMHTMNSFGRSGHNIRLFTFRIMALQAKLYASLDNPKPPKF